MKTFLLILGVLLFGGCTTLKPSVAEYSMVAQGDLRKSTQKGCTQKSLKVAQAFSQSTPLSLQMHYTQEDGRVFAYSQSQWQETPQSFITAALLQNIRDFELFKSVHPYQSRVKTDLILESNIEEFMQFFTKDMQSSSVHIRLSLALMDAKTNAVVATKILQSKTPAGMDAASGVKAYAGALGAMMAEMQIWLEEQCR